MLTSWGLQPQCWIQAFFSERRKKLWEEDICRTMTYSPLMYHPLGRGFCSTGKRIFAGIELLASTIDKHKTQNNSGRHFNASEKEFHLFPRPHSKFIIAQLKHFYWIFFSSPQYAINMHTTSHNHNSNHGTMLT